LDDQFVATSTYDIVRLIEDEGWEACPIFPNPDVINNMGVAVEPGKPAPNVTPDFNFAAVQCGLGEIGDNGLFLSPELGPRVRFQMILTDLELPNDPPFEYHICDHCGLCAAACPLGAFDFASGTYNNALCRDCLNGGTPNRLHPRAEPDRMAAACTRACIRHLAEIGVGKMNSAFVPKKEWAKDRQGRVL
ncbi:MAG: hypothetical protein GX633_03285, partial [Clostridiales bacterium]|nr:hypothetical protein [Clostridiales bacterium]